LTKWLVATSKSICRKIFNAHWCQIIQVFFGYRYAQPILDIFQFAKLLSFSAVVADYEHWVIIAKPCLSWEFFWVHICL